MIKILVVDDEKDIKEFVSEFFEEIGYKVFSTTDPFKVMPLVEKEKPDVVLLDILMPELSGKDILKEIKTKNKDTKVIMVTMVDDPKVKEECLSLGADEYVKKPFTTEYLESVVMKKVSEIIDFSKARILVVEDELETLEHIRKSLDLIVRGEITAVSNADEAIKKILEVNFDVVLLDIKLPGKSGLDVIKEVKKKKALPDIIIVSGYDSNDIVKQLLKEGVVDYVPKPIDIKILYRKVRDILKKKGKRMEEQSLS